MPIVLPPHAVAWFESQGVDPEEAITLPPARFVRAVGDETAFGDRELAELCDDLGLTATNVKPVSWMPKPLRFWSLPRDAPLARARAVKLGLLQGMDAASGACVAALGVQPGHRVLDLCCSPGAKFLALLDCLHGVNLKCEGVSDHDNYTARDQTGDDANSSSRIGEKSISEGCLDGIDVSEGRLRVCRSLIARALESRWASHATNPDTTTTIETAASNRLRVRLVCSDGRHWAGLLGSVAEAAKEPKGLGKLVFDSAAHYAELEGRRPPKLKTMNTTAGSAAEQNSTGNDPSISSTMEQSPGGEMPRKRLNKSARAREAKRLKALIQEAAAATEASDYHTAQGPSTPLLYDRVLVDADCSTDGSAKHLNKVLMGCMDENGYKLGEAIDSVRSTSSSSGGGGNDSSAKVDRNNSGSQRLEKLLSPEATARHVSTQSLLLANGFKLLAPGGVLVYATCSLTHAQNEGVVAAFLAAEPTAALMPVPFATSRPSSDPKVQHTDECDMAGAPAFAGDVTVPPTIQQTGSSNPAYPVNESLPWAPGGLPHTLRFSARRGTSGLFLARITKQCT